MNKFVRKIKKFCGSTINSDMKTNIDTNTNPYIDLKFQVFPFREKMAS